MLNIVFLCCMLRPIPPVHHLRPAPIPQYKGVRALAALQAGAVIADGITTHQYVKRGFVELDPVVKPLIGTQPTYTRMIPIGAVEVAGSYFLARKWPVFRYLQVGFTVGHGICAVHNARL